VATTPTLRPLGVGEILDAGIKLYLRHWKPLMICVVAIVLPVRILSVLAVAAIDPHDLGTHFSGMTTTSASSTQIDWTAFGAAMVVAGSSVLSSLLATAACLKAVSDAWLGAAPDAGRSLRFAVGRLPALIALLAIAAIALTLAFMALIVPSVWLAVSWCLAVPALLFERVGPFRALGRSLRLVRGRWWATLATVVVAYLMASIVGGVLQLIPTGIANGVARDGTVAAAVAYVVGGTLTSMVTMPFTAAVLTLLYFDQRVRKEAFDRRVLAEGLGAPRDATVEPPAAVPPSRQPPASRDWWRDPAPAGPEVGGFSPPRADDAGESDAAGGSLPGGSPEAAAGSAPDSPPPSEEQPRRGRDRGRADWLPPEAPRGPGGV
jgi:hypothetical protein